MSHKDTRQTNGCNFSIRMNRDLKTESEELFRSLGMSLTTAIQIFLKQSVIRGGIPFEVSLPNYKHEPFVTSSDIGGNVSTRVMKVEV